MAVLLAGLSAGEDTLPQPHRHRLARSLCRPLTGDSRRLMLGYYEKLPLQATDALAGGLVRTVVLAM
jgi:hypothetical protein